MLNASDLGIDVRHWDPLYATKWLMDAIKDSLDMNVKSKKYAQFWRTRGKRIETVEDLLLSYYASMKVVLIPGLGRPNLMQTQIETLYQVIAAASDHSSERKKESRMLLDAREFQLYLQFAFDFFSNTLDQPFDFVQASFANNSISSNFANNILRLAIAIMEACADRLKAEHLFDELSFMVASCIMLDSTRRKIRGMLKFCICYWISTKNDTT